MKYKKTIATTATISLFTGISIAQPIESYVHEYLRDVQANKYETIQLKSANDEVQIKYMVEKNNVKHAFVNSIALCNDLHCKVFKYQNNQLALIEKPHYRYFHATLGNSYADGYICDKNSYACISYIKFDVTHDKLDDFEQKFYLYTAKNQAFNLDKVTSDLF